MSDGATATFVRSPVDRLIGALCMMEAGWTGEGGGASHKAYLEARQLILERAALERTRSEEDAILAAADAIRERRATTATKR